MEFGKNYTWSIAGVNLERNINFFDVSLLLIGYQAQDPLADWNGDGAWDYFDVSGFIMDYFVGCP